MTRQRPVLRVCAELALVGIIRDAPGKSGGEWIMKAIRELVRVFHSDCGCEQADNFCQLSNDPSLSSLPLLSIFLKSYSRPYLGIVPPALSKQISASSEPGTLSEEATKEANTKSTTNGVNGTSTTAPKEEEELVEKEIRDRFKKMCEGYFESVCKKLVIEHNVSLGCARVGRSAIYERLYFSGCRTRTEGTTKPTSALARSSKIGNRLTRK